MKFRHVIVASSLTLSLAPPAFPGASPVDPAAIKVPNKVANQAIPFDLNQVQLLDGPFKSAQELDRRDLLAENMDILYYPFRREAKLDTPVKGSDSLNYTATGHVLGHWLSASAFIIRNTGDAELKAKADAAVAELARCQDARGDGFCGGFPPESILSTNRAQRAGVPWYCLHKIYAGLLDMYVLTGNQQALDVLKKAADWAIKFTDPLSDEQFQAMLRTEHGGINEVLANLYGVTGEEKYLKLSRRFYHHAILDPFANGGDSLERVHANTQFPKFIGIARLYELTGEPDLNTIATSFWHEVVYERSYVTGGNSLGEQFTPKATLSTAVGQNTTETCNEYNMLRLSRALFCQDPKPEYADFFERTLYNQILSTRNPETGGQLYFQQLQSGRKKGPWLVVNRASQCCFGTGLESNAKYADGIYYRDASGNILFVNLFVPSELSWKDKGITLRQETRYPDEGMTSLKITADKPVELTLNIRRPWWATERFTVTINGDKQQSAGAPGSYVQLKRTWKTGDAVEVAMPMSFRMEGFKDNPKRAAVMYGPLVMAAVTEANDRMSAIVTEDKPEKFLSTLKPVAGRPLEFTAPASLFRTSAQPGDQPVTIKPLLRMLDESYAVYWDQMSPEEFAENPPRATSAQGNRGQ
jgi:uncharacterized protein